MPALQESPISTEGAQHEEETPSEGRAGPRQPLHQLSSRASLADRLPPRPSELLKVPAHPHALHLLPARQDSSWHAGFMSAGAGRGHNRSQGKVGCAAVGELKASVCAVIIRASGI